MFAELTAYGRRQSADRRCERPVTAATGTHNWNKTTSIGPAWVPDKNINIQPTFRRNTVPLPIGDCCASVGNRCTRSGYIYYTKNARETGKASALPAAAVRESA